MVDHLWCKDINECAYTEDIDPDTLILVRTATENNKCPTLESCRNKIGSYECQESFGTIMTSVMFLKINWSRRNLKKCLESEGFQPDPTDCELTTGCACKDYDECANDLHDCAQSNFLFLLDGP